MITRASKSRVSIAALLLAVGLLSVDSAARASSISGGGTQPERSIPSSAMSNSDSLIGFSNSGLTLAETANSQAALDLAAIVSLADLQPRLSLVLEHPLETAPAAGLSSGAPTFLTEAALPLTVSDVPEPTAFGLLLLGLAGLFVARRIARTA